MAKGPGLLFPQQQLSLVSETLSLSDDLITAALVLFFVVTPTMLFCGTYLCGEFFAIQADILQHVNLSGRNGLASPC